MACSGLSYRPVNRARTEAGAAAYSFAVSWVPAALAGQPPTTAGGQSAPCLPWRGSRAVQVRSPQYSATVAATSAASVRERKGPMASRAGVRTMAKRGNGSSVSVIHQARLGNFERRLYGGV